MRWRAAPEHPMPPHLCKAGTASVRALAHRGSGAEQRTLGLRPPHEAGQRAAERLLVELDRAIRALQELRRGGVVGLEGGVGPGAAEPLSYLEVALPAGDVQRCLSPVGVGVEGGARAVQPLGDVEVTFEAGGVQRCPPLVVGGSDRGAHAVQPLGDAEVALAAGDMQWCITTVGGDVDRGACTVQPLGDVEVTFEAGGVQRCPPHVVGGTDRGAHAVQPLGDAEVALVAGEVQRCLSRTAGGVDRGALTVQPLSDVGVTIVAGELKCLHTTTILRPHARAVRHRCLRCRQIARPHGSTQPQARTFAGARARCGCDRRLSSRYLCTCAGGDGVSVSACTGAAVQGSGPWACARRTRQASVLRSSAPGGR
eukprot:scaffold51384_cov70-Phaeocystis_antarctica.AAC.2